MSQFGLHQMHRTTARISTTTETLIEALTKLLYCSKLCKYDIILERTSIWIDAVLCLLSWLIVYIVLEAAANHFRQAARV